MSLCLYHSFIRAWLTSAMPKTQTIPEAWRRQPTGAGKGGALCARTYIHINREPELRPKTVASYRWQLSNHLLVHFADYPLSAITAEAIDGFKAAKLREGVIGPNQINKMLGLLGSILKVARRYGYLESNPLDDVDRLKRTRPRRPTIEPEQLPALLDAAGRLRPILATLAGAGLRNGEACALEWPDVRLATGTVVVCAAKTDAGMREVDLPLALREELSDLKVRAERRLTPERLGAIPPLVPQSETLGPGRSPPTRIRPNRSTNCEPARCAQRHTPDTQSVVRGPVAGQADRGARSALPYGLSSAGGLPRLGRARFQPASTPRPDRSVLIGCHGSDERECSPRTSSGVCGYI
jgi:hypothetical protein